ncbi:MAG TPA: hypothetical protein DCX12_07405 [Chloroflexi bacterium]|nr:hypothetical protein [Chloroflexota bacterium]HBV95420.1 hypothetical protein [Chloroflexota bacterium]
MIVRREPDPYAVPASSRVSFDLVLTLRNAAGAEARDQAVSSPGSAQFHQYLTDAQWEAQHSPSQSDVAAAESWLASEGFSVGTVPADGLFSPLRAPTCRCRALSRPPSATTRSTGRRCISPAARCPSRRLSAAWCPAWKAYRAAPRPSAGAGPRPACCRCNGVRMP